MWIVTIIKENDEESKIDFYAKHTADIYKEGVEMGLTLARNYDIKVTISKEENNATEQG